MDFQSIVVELKPPAPSLPPSPARLCCLPANTASAAPTITVDVDSINPGIQSTLNVALGTTFSVVVGLTADAGALPTIFNALGLQVSFNDAGPVLTPGPTGAIAGTLASVPILTLDAIAAGFVAPGSPLASGASLLAPGFTGSSGAFALVGIPDFTLFSGTSVSILTIDFVASAVGTSAIFPSNAPIASSAILNFFGSPVPVNLIGGAVIVTGPTPTVPEPASLALLGLGLFGFSKTRRQKAGLPQVA